jgi:hypothetical protein
MVFLANRFARPKVLKRRHLMGMEVNGILIGPNYWLGMESMVTWNRMVGAQ